MPAKRVFRHARAECVGGDRVRAAQQLELISGTIMCTIPFIVQTEQLHTETSSRSPWTRNLTWPQWQPPS